MARKRTLSTLDTSISYEAVGLDLAKEDVALAAFDPDHKEPYHALRSTWLRHWSPWSHVGCSSDCRAD